MNKQLNELVFSKIMGSPTTLLAMVPDYSGDIVHASKVIERMFFRGWRVTLMQGVNGQWNTQFHSLKNMGLAVEDTAPEAICRAALRALEVPGV